jgi:hypothetical protein
VGHIHLIKTGEGYEVLYVDGRKVYQGTGVPSETWMHVVAGVANRRMVSHIVWYDDPAQIPERFPDELKGLALPTAGQLHLIASHA